MAKEAEREESKGAAGAVGPALSSAPPSAAKASSATGLSPAMPAAKVAALLKGAAGGMLAKPAGKAQLLKDIQKTFGNAYVQQVLAAYGDHHDKPGTGGPASAGAGSKGRAARGSPAGVSPPLQRRALTPLESSSESASVPVPAGVQLSSARVSSPDDPAEKEAEATAKSVMRMPDPRPAAAAPATARSAGKNTVHRKPEAAIAAPVESIREKYATPTVARKAEGGRDAGPKVMAQIAGSKGGGAPLPTGVRRFMEPRFRAGFGNVRVHTGEGAAKMSRQLGAQAFTHGNQIFFGRGQWKPDSPEGRELIAHELTHTIQQGAAVQRGADIQRSADVTVNQREATHVQRRVPGLGAALDYFADKANIIPGFRMFTILLGLNPINMSTVDRSAANILRAVVEFMPGGYLITKALDTYGVFDKVGSWIEQQLKSLGITGSSIRAAVDEFLDSIGATDLFNLGGLWDRAKRIFTDPIDRIIDFVKSLAVAVLQFIKDAILRPLAELASKEPAWDLLCAVIGTNPITGEAVPRTAETLIGGFMKLIGQEEIWENIKKGNAIARAFAWFQNALNGLVGFVKQIPGLFLQALKSLEIADIVVLPLAFIKVGKVFAGFFVKFVSWAGETIWDLLEIIFSVVAPSVIAYLKKAQAAFKKILKDPIGFVGNLINAGKQGLNQFVAKFPEHLKASLIGWLTGALGGAGVYIPQAFTLVEIGKCVLSVLGLSWPQIRGKIVKALGPNGETIMKGLETGFSLVKALVTGGPGALWDMIKQKLTDLRDTVLQAIISYVKDRIIQRAIITLVSMLNPAGAFIQAVIAIYNGVMAFVERMKQIAQVVAAFIDSISAIADGAIDAAANRVEQTMGGILTLVISFLARLVGLGNVSEKVVELIKKLQAKVDAALEKGITWIIEKAKGLFKSLFKKKDKKAGGTVGETVPFGGGGESHTLSVKVQGKSAKVMMASALQRPDTWIAKLRSERLGELNDEKKQKAEQLFQKAEGLLSKAGGEANQAAEGLGDSPTGDQAKAESANAALTADEKLLATTLGEICELFGLVKPSEKWAKQIAKMHALAKSWAPVQLDAGIPETLKLKSALAMREWLSGRPALVDPLNGPFATPLWSEIAKTSPIVQGGQAAGFTDLKKFGTLEKQALASAVGSGQLAALRRDLFAFLLEGGSVSAATPVRNFVKGLVSAQITGETAATVPYTEFAAWDGTILDFAWPKHISWKAANPGYAFGLEAHHIWPQYLGGVNVQTVQARATIHQTGYHTKHEKPLLPGGLGTATTLPLKRTKTSVKAAYFAAKASGTNAALFALMKSLLLSSYVSFQAGQVKTGNFNSVAAGVINGVSEPMLSF